MNLCSFGNVFEPTFPPSVIAKYCRIIDLLESVDQNLFRYNSLNYYKTLSRNKRGIESVKVNDKYRIEMKITKDFLILLLLYLVL